MSDLSTRQLMDAFCPLPSPEKVAELQAISSEVIKERLIELNVVDADVSEVTEHWNKFQESSEWLQRLAAVLALQDSQRGVADAPSAIWDDMNETTSGRLFYFYVVALDAQNAREYWRERSLPEHIIELSLTALGRHAAIHRRIHHNAGVNAGWWLLLTLRGDLVHMGSLQFQLVGLKYGTFSPEPWYNDDEAAARGPGFMKGDPSLGLHMPDRTDLSKAAIDRTLEEAREVLGRLWPARKKRLATTQTWMLDDRLGDYLPEESNIVQFQRRFELVPYFHDDDENVREFVFRDTTTPLDELVATSSVQRAVLDVLRNGGHWRDRSGWFVFDGL
jgi:GNAT-like C-terminal domain/N-acyltransferase N-terminal domain